MVDFLLFHFIMSAILYSVMTLKQTQWLKAYLKGLAIGGAAIIPGVSGGTVAFLLKVYDDLIHALAQLFHKPWQSLVTLLPYIFGMVTSVIVLSYPIGLAFTYYPLPTVSAFVGLILGSLPSMRHKLPKVTSPNQWLWLVIPAGIASALGLFSVIGQLDATEVLTAGLFLPKIILLVVGFLGVSAFIVPGISGSMLLLSIGFYQPILESMQRLVAMILQGTEAWMDILNFSLLGIGALLGFIGISQFMRWALTKHRQQVEWSVFGFIIGSIFSIYINYEILPAYLALNLGITLLSGFNLILFGWLSFWFHQQYAA
jgi:putative membrane protein